MADQQITIPDLGSLTAGQASDLLLATRGTTGYKMLLSDLAKYMVETYNSSSLAGSAQSVKNALDSLNSRTQWYYVRQTSSAVNVSVSFSKYQTTSIISCVCSSGLWGIWLYSNGYLLPIKIVGNDLSATLSSGYTTVTISKTEGLASSMTISLFNTLDIPSVTDTTN